MRELSSFEAAVLYDYMHSRQEMALPVTVLVVDLDRCALGICRCGEGGDLELLVQEEEPGMRVTALDRLPQAGRAAALAEIRQAMRRFYRTGGRRDGPACTLPEVGELLCSQLDQDFAPDARRLNALLNRGLDFLAGLRIPEDALRILAIGEMAAYYPAEHALRRRLSPAPDLPDSRFAVLADPPGEVVRLGQALYRESAEHDATLLCIRADGQRDEIVLAERGRPDVGQDVYCPPVFISAVEPLFLRIDGRERTLKLPFIPEEGDLVELSCRTERAGLLLLLRRTLVPEQVYEIEISYGGNKPL